MALSMYDIKRILRPKKDQNLTDDFRMIDSWSIFKEGNKVNERKLDYLCYELETINPETGEKYHFYKALKFLRVIRLPKDAKQSLSFMEKHTQVLTSVWEQGINLVTVIANIKEPVPIGLLYLYGVQGVAVNLEEAKKQAHEAYIGFQAAMQGTYRVLEMRCINAQETEWLREKMYNMDYMTVVRGIPKANEGGEDAGNKGAGGKNLNPNSQGTLEEIIAGMVDYEYVIQVLSTPVYKNTLRDWSRKTQREMTDWNGQLQGTKSFSFNLSLPMMFGANQSSSQGWNKAYTNANSVNYSHGESFSTGYGENVGQSLSNSFGQSFGQTQGTNVSETYSQSHGISQGQTVGQTIGYTSGVTQTSSQSFGSNVSHSTGFSNGTSLGSSLGSSMNHNYSIGSSQNHSDGTSSGQTHGISSGTSQNVNVSQGASTNHSVGSSNGETFGLSNGQSHTIGASNGTSTNHSVGQSAGQTVGQSTGNSYTMGTGSSTGSSQSFGTSDSVNSSNSVTYGNTTGTTTGKTMGTTEGISNGTNSSTSASHSESGTHTTGTSNTQGTSANAGISHNNGTGWGVNDNTSTNFGGGLFGFSAGASGGHGNSMNGSVSDGWSASYGNSASQGTSTSDSTGHSDSSSSSFGQSSTSSSSTSVSDSTSVSNSTSLSNGSSYGTSHGTNESFSTNQSNSLSESWGVNESISTSQNIGRSISDGYGTSQSVSDSYGTNSGASYSQNFGNSVTDGYGTSASISNGYGTNNGISDSFNVGQSSSDGYGTSTSTSDGYGTNVGQSYSTNTGTNTGDSYGTSYSISSSTGLSESVSNSQSISNSQTESYTNSQGQSVGQSYSESTTQNVSQGTTDSYGTSKSVNQGDSYSEGTGQSQSLSTGSSGAYVSGTSSSMGMNAGIGYNKSYQWLDQQVQDILELLKFKNERIKKALRGEGMFYTYVYIACPDQDALSAAMTVAKSTWQNEFAMTEPVQVLELNEDEQQHLLYHFAAFSSDVTRERVYGVDEYKYATALLPGEFAAYSHLPRISEGGIFTEVNDVPKFSVPSMKKGEIYMGKVLSAERYSPETGYETPFDYRLDESELMHGYFTGASRSGKTVAAMRFVAELARVRRKKTGKRMRIVCMDPKQDWRTLARYVEPERFNFYSLGKVDFHPIHLNPLKIPRGVEPQFWIDGLIDIYCRAYGLLERGKQMMGETIYALYEEAGVFEARKLPDGIWQDEVTERSRQVTFRKVYLHMEHIKAELENPANPKGKAGNDTRDAYARLLDRLQAFNREFAVEYKLFAQEDGIGVDDLIGADDVTVLESKGLEKTFRNFIFGIITSGFYKFAIAHEGGFLAKDQFETLLVIEEANEVLTGNDAAGSGGGASTGLTVAGQSEFEEILDQSAGYGLFIIAITQRISLMPASIVANSGLVFAGKLKTAEDVTTVIRSIAREERYEDRDLVKWFPRSPIGWFVCQSSRCFDFKDMEPVLIHVSQLNIAPPSNSELDEIIAMKRAA